MRCRLYDEHGNVYLFRADDFGILDGRKKRPNQMGINKMDKTSKPGKTTNLSSLHTDLLALYYIGEFLSCIIHDLQGGEFTSMSLSLYKGIPQITFWLRARNQSEAVHSFTFSNIDELRRGIVTCYNHIVAEE